MSRFDARESLSCRVGPDADGQSDIEYLGQKDKFTIASNVPDWIAPLFCVSPELLRMLKQALRMFTVEETPDGKAKVYILTASLAGTPAGSQGLINWRKTSEGLVALAECGQPLTRTDISKDGNP